MKAFIKLTRDPRHEPGDVWMDCGRIESVASEQGATWVTLRSGSGYYVKESIPEIFELIDQAERGGPGFQIDWDGLAREPRGFA
jgi:hypothetical protein